MTTATIPRLSAEELESQLRLPRTGYAFIACRSVWRARTARQGVLRPVARLGAAGCGLRDGAEP